MRIAVSSGKGGTGKTFISTNLAVMLAEMGEQVTYVDCDVEEPNGHLFMKPEVESTETLYLPAPVETNLDKCTGCGRCADACHYNAIAVVKG